MANRLALLGLAVTAAATPVSARVPDATLAPAAYALSGYSKADAILGGPSRLSALVAQQQGLPAPVQTAFPAPASKGSLRTLFTRGWDRASDRTALTTGRPDVFGSTALAVSRTPLDSRWRKVARARVHGAPAAFATTLRDRDEVERAEAVNRYVNGRVQFADDIRQYGRPDHWTTASETLRRGVGDCEDYAVAKLQLLRLAGIEDRNLYLVIVKDLARRSDHAVLVVRAGERMLVLDNGTDRLLDTWAVTDYRPVISFSASGAWTHGYRRSLLPVTMAAALPGALAPASRP